MPTPTFELNVFSGLEYDLPLCSIQLVPYSQRREYLISPRSSQRKVNRRFGHNAQQNRAKSSVWKYMPVSVLLKFHSSRQILDPLPRASRHGVRWNRQEPERQVPSIAVETPANASCPWKCIASAIAVNVPETAEPIDLSRDEERRSTCVINLPRCHCQRHGTRCHFSGT